MQSIIPTASAKMGSDVLDVRPIQQEQRTTADHSVSRECPDRHDYEPAPSTSGTFYTPSMKNLVWEDLFKDWSPQEKELIGSSWRHSTLQSEKMKTNSKYPRGQDLARFLADLSITKGLSYNTILFHKSAITNYCAGRPSSDSSTDFLVWHTVKVILIIKPREIKSRIWDTQILLAWLAKPTNNLSFFETSRRTAASL